MRPPQRAFKPDGAIYALVGRETLAGSVPYRDVWDNKGPLLLFTYAGLYAVLGCRPLLFDMFLNAWILLLAWAAFVLGRYLWGQVGGLGAAGAVIFASIFPATRELNAEILGEGFALLGMYALLVGLASQSRAQLVGAGAALALIPLAKPVFCLEVIAALSGVLVWACDRGREPPGTGAPSATGPVRGTGAVILLLAVGAVAALSPFFLYFAAHGALSDVVEVYLRSNFVYVQATPLKAALRGAVEFLEGPVFAISALWVAGLAGLVGLWSGGRPRHERVIICSWFVASLVGVTLGRRFFWHYLVQAVGPAAVLSGHSVATLWQGLRSGHRLARSLAVAFSLSLAFLVGSQLVVRLYNAVHNWRLAPHEDRFIATELETARYLKAHTSPEDTLFVVGLNAHLNLITGLRPASRFIYTRYLVEAATPEAQRRVWSLWRRDMEQHRPKYIVLSNYNYLLESHEGAVARAPELQQLLRREYTYETTIRGRGEASPFYNVLYRRKDSPPTSASHGR